MDKKVSIIIPVYNTKPEYIQEAIESALNQTYKNIEIIVVNDGSTDNETLEYLKTINDKHIKIINQDNKGLGGARNTGITNATGDYIGFLDADDWISKDYYEKLINICENNNCDMSCGILTRVNLKNKEYPADVHENNIIDNFMEKIKLVANGSVCSKLFKKELFNDIRFQEHYYWEDNPVLVKLLLKSKNVGYTNLVKYFYRENPESICCNPDDTKRLKRNTDATFILNEICNLDYKSNQDKDLVIKTFAPLLINLADFGLDKAIINANNEKVTLRRKHKKYKKLFNIFLYISLAELVLIIYLALRGVNFG